MKYKYDLVWTIKWLGTWQTIGACHFLASFFIAPDVKRKRKQLSFLPEPDVDKLPTSPVSTIPPAQVLGVFKSKDLLSTDKLSGSVGRSIVVAMGRSSATIQELQEVSEGLSEWSKNLDSFDGFSPSTIARKLEEWVDRVRKKKAKQEEKFKGFMDRYKV